MNKIVHFQQETPWTPLCKFCGDPTRLIGSERDPGKYNTDLLTYICSACDEFEIVRVESAPHR